MPKLSERLSRAVEGRYEIMDELGRGGMSMVFQARDVRHDRIVAVKVLLPELAASVGAQRFLREIEIAAGLVHPHILPLYDSGEAEGLLYHVTPSIDGETLRDRLKRERYLSIEEASRITAEVSDALDFAHAQGVIHRDIKPENILLTRRHALITDFGIARAITLGGGERLTETGMAVGTPAYMSPEQARGEAVLDGRSDIYSLACVTYEMMAGEPPLAGRSPQITMARRQAESPASLVLLRETVPEALDAVVLKALSRLPADRYPTAGQYMDAVQMAVGAASGAHASVSTPSVVTLPPSAHQAATVGASPSQAGGRLSFWEELKRRKVYNVGVIYMAASIGIVSFLANMKEIYGQAAWYSLLPILLLVGLPVSLFLAWTFEVSREGVRRTGTYEIAAERERRWPIVSRQALIAVLIIGAAYAVFEIVRRLFFSPS